MNFTPFLSGIVIAVIFAFIVRKSFNSEAIDLEDGGKQLIVHKGIRILAYVLLFSGFFTTIVFAALSEVNNWLIFAIPAIALTSSLASYFFLFSKRHRASYSEGGVQHFNFRGEEIKFSWHEVENMTYSKFYGARILIVKGKKLKFSDFLVGGKQFEAFAKSKITLKK